MKKTFLLIIIFIVYFNTMLCAEDLFYRDHGHLYAFQWGALEEILTDWKNKTITTDECIIYGCYVLAAKEPSNPDSDIKAKLIPKKYDLNKKSKEAGPSFFVYYLYKFDEYAGKEARLEFKKSDWSDQEFIDEYTNNEAFIKIINDAQPQFEDGKKYIHYCDLINIASQKNIICYDTLTYKHFMAHIGLRRYMSKIKPFEEKNNFNCFENKGVDCPTGLVRAEDTRLSEKYLETFNIIPNNIQRKRKLINTLNHNHYCTVNCDELRDK